MSSATGNEGLAAKFVSAFSILAPIPVDHLESGLLVASKKDYVSYGSDKWEVFQDADAKRGEKSVLVLIYPSLEYGVPKPPYEVSWGALYIGHTGDPDEKMCDFLEGYRPESTHSCSGDLPWNWGLFWRIQDLQPLPLEHRIKILGLPIYGSPGKKLSAWPRGPELVSTPDWAKAHTACD